MGRLENCCGWWSCACAEYRKKEEEGFLSLWEGDRGAATAQGVVVSSSWEGDHHGAAVAHEVSLLKGSRWFSSKCCLVNCGFVC